MSVPGQYLYTLFPYIYTMPTPSILLFGANGYVGGTIASAARQENHHVTEIGSRDFPFWEDVGMWPKELLETPADTAIIAADFETRVAHGDESLAETLRKKFTAFIDRLRVKRIIFLSTDAVFDGLHGPYTESDPLSPLTAYGRCKRDMETIITRYPNTHIVRPSVVWGPGATRPDVRRLRFLEKESEQYRGATNAFRSPIEVSHLARTIIRMTQEEAPPKIVHIATPRMNYFDFLRSCLFPEISNRVIPWTDPAIPQHDTSLITEYAQLIHRLIN